MDEYKGEVIYDYYSEDYANREFGVLNKWEKELQREDGTLNGMILVQ